MDMTYDHWEKHAPHAWNNVRSLWTFMHRAAGPLTRRVSGEAC